MIEVENAVPGYSSRALFKAVDGASLRIAKGEVVGIAGESRSGKSRLMRAIYGDFSTGLRMEKAGRSPRGSTATTRSTASICAPCGGTGFPTSRKA